MASVLLFSGFLDTTLGTKQIQVVCSFFNTLQKHREAWLSLHGYLSLIHLSDRKGQSLTKDTPVLQRPAFQAVFLFSTFSQDILLDFCYLGNFEILQLTSCSSETNFVFVQDSTVLRCSSGVFPKLLFFCLNDNLDVSMENIAQCYFYTAMTSFPFFLPLKDRNFSISQCKRQL